jgi:predicted AAA+ superfamily ATPase
MMLIQRDFYLNQLLRKRANGLVKIITGIRRCGKSFFLFKLFYDYLLQDGVPRENIITLALDQAINAKYRNPLLLDAYIRERVADARRKFYVFLDEIQQVLSISNPYLDHPEAKIGFVDVLLGLMELPNVDIYVTGSNSRMLSSDIVTEFRDRGDELRLHPLSFQEFYSHYTGEKRHAWRNYYTYGGLPRLARLTTHAEKSQYLQGLFANIYLKDIMERQRILHEKSLLDDLLNVVASSIGSLTNPTRIANTFKSEKGQIVAANTLSNYLNFFIDAFLLTKASRYDIKGRRLINSPLKYYFEDVGLRNARLDFRQQEINHIMENVIFNELCRRGFNVNVGVVHHNYKKEDGQSARAQLEVDFVADKAGDRFYIQSALNIGDKAKREQETRSLRCVDDSFKKIIVVNDDIVSWNDEHGIEYVSIEDFLLQEKVN